MEPGKQQRSKQYFLADYEQYMVDVATMAQANSADRMTIGTELKALTCNTDNNAKWAGMIDAVDNAFAVQRQFRQ